MAVRDLGTIFVKTVGAFIVVIALSVLTGWVIKSAALVQINQAFEPMKFNAALMLMLFGMALIFIDTRAQRLSLVFSACGALIACATLIQYWLNINLHIDTLFIDPFVQKRTLYPGRMSPNTAMAGFVTGLAIFILSAPATHLRQWHYFVIALLGSVVAALGAAPLLGYFTGTQDGHIWGLMVGMAVHTAVAYFVLGACILSISAQRTAPIPRWLPVPVFVLLAALTLTLYHAALTDSEERIRRMSDAHAEASAQLIERAITDFTLALKS